MTFYDMLMAVRCAVLLFSARPVVLWKCWGSSAGDAGEGRKTKCGHHFCCLSRNRISLLTVLPARAVADGTIIRHIVIKMYYMLILYYEALERNVNLSQVYSVFKKQTQAPERNGTRREGSDGTGITIPRDSSSFFRSRCFIHFSLSPLFICPSFHRLVSPSRFQLKLHLFPSSHPFLSFLLLSSQPSCNFLPSVTRLPSCQAGKSYCRPAVLREKTHLHLLNITLT